MRFFHSLLALLSIVSLTLALAKQDDGGDTTTKTTQLTTVWVTLTTNGKVTTSASLYSQLFTIAYSEATAEAASGSEGLGSLSGSVGGVRTYEQTTITSKGGAGDYLGTGAGAVTNALALIAGVLFL